MDHTNDIKLGRTLIHNADNAVHRFINDWCNGADYIVAHTSGSTGIPKEIRLLKQDLVQSAIATCDKFSITEQSKLALPLSPEYIAGKMMIVRAIVSGAELFIEKPSNTPISIDYGKIDMLPLVPSQIQGFLNSPYRNNASNVIIGGGAIPPNLEQKLNQSQTNYYATYGMTETCSHVALRHIGAQNAYEALPDITFSIDNRNCLIINAPRFSFKEIITNDIVRLTGNTSFEWIGRWDNVINSGGIKLYPEEIEKKLLRIIDYPFYIIGEPDDKWGEQAVLYIECVEINDSILYDKIAKVLDKYEMPKKIKCVKNFQRTLSNKIKRISF